MGEEEGGGGGAGAKLHTAAINIRFLFRGAKIHEGSLRKGSWTNSEDSTVLLLEVINFAKLTTFPSDLMIRIHVAFPIATFR